MLRCAWLFGRNPKKSQQGLTKGFGSIQENWAHVGLFQLDIGG